MQSASPGIVRCPPQHVAEAIGLALSDIAPSQRREIAGELLNTDGASALTGEMLFVALRGARLCGASWAQRQKGNVALLWPPQLVSGETDQTALQLAEAVVRELDETAVEMTQALLPSRDAAAAPVLLAVGYRFLAELLYMSCEANRFPVEPPNAGELEFEPYESAKRDRLNSLVERTYQQTLDCEGLNGMRTMEDVIEGYQGTGVFRAENWQFCRNRGEDVGVLLLAEHPQARHWELMYMGLVPEARGRRWGEQIAQHAKWLARAAGIERIVLAVDEKNAPARQIYAAAGFEMWDRRTVYVRFPGGK